MSQKRISRELVLLEELMKKHKINFSVYQIGHTDIIEKLGLFSNNNELLLEINLNESYPFRIPCLIIPYKNNKICINTYKKYEIWCSKIINKNDYKLSLNDYDDKLLNAYVFTHINIPLVNKYFDIPTNKTCLCCNSITCGYKWSPSCKIFDLIMEFLCFKKFETFLKPYTYRLITKIFNNDRWIICHDIQLHILSFIDI